MEAESRQGPLHQCMHRFSTLVKPRHAHLMLPDTSTFKCVPIHSSIKTCRAGGPRPNLIKHSIQVSEMFEKFYININPRKNNFKPPNYWSSFTSFKILWPALKTCFEAQRGVLLILVQLIPPGLKIKLQLLRSFLKNLVGLLQS